MENINIEIQKTLQKAIDYQDFVLEFKQHSENKTNSGTIQSEDLVNYTKLNYSRTKRLNKTLNLTKETLDTIQKLNSKITFLILTESWCGDAAQTVPVFFKASEASANISLKIAYRDENEGLMNHFLTNGNKAIPIVVLLDENKKLITHWGPRPATATKMVSDFKNANGSLTPDFKKDLQLWYNKNKGEDTMNDIINVFNNLID